MNDALTGFHNYVFPMYADPLMRQTTAESEPQATTADMHWNSYGPPTMVAWQNGTGIGHISLLPDLNDASAGILWSDGFDLALGQDGLLGQRHLGC